LYPLPAQVTDPDKLAPLDIRRRDRLGGILHEYPHVRNLRGRDFRQVQRYRQPAPGALARALKNITSSTGSIRTR